MQNIFLYPLAVLTRSPYKYLHFCSGRRKISNLDKRHFNNISLVLWESVHDNYRRCLSNCSGNLKTNDLVLLLEVEAG